MISPALLKPVAGFESPTDVGGLLCWLDSDNDVLTDGAVQLLQASSQYLSLANASIGSLAPGSDSFSFAGWVYLGLKSTNRTVVSLWETTGSEKAWQLKFANSPDRFRFQVSEDGSAVIDVDADTLGSPSLDTWIFIACGWDKANDKLWISTNDGTVTENTSIGISSINTSSADFLIGAAESDSPVFFWHKRLDSLGYWNKVLSSAEITSLYNSGAGKIHAGLDATELISLYAWWNMDESSGSRLDSTANNKDLTANNTPTLVAGIASGTAATDDPVADWLDQTDNSYDFEQTANGQRPTKKSLGFDFDGSDDNLENTTWGPQNAAGTIIIPFKATSNDFVLFSGEKNDGSTSSLTIGVNASNKAFVEYISLATSETVTGGTSVSTGDWHVISVTGVFIPIFEWTIRLDGAYETLSGTNIGSWFDELFSGTPIHIGGRIGNTDNIDGVIGDVLVYDSVLSGSDQRDIEQYMATQFGITLS